MDPQYVGFNALENPPIITETIKLQRYYWSAINEINNINFIIKYLNIKVDNLPKKWNKKGEFGKFDIPELIINLEKWREIIQLTPLKSPMRFAYVTSKYGWRQVGKSSKKSFHHGTDFASTWRADVRPTAVGKVIFAGRDGSFGNVIKIQHANNLTTVYAHLAKITTQVGELVTENMIIGNMGNTGRSRGAHLHYEIRNNGKSIDPEKFLNVGHQISITGYIPRHFSF